MGILQAGLLEWVAMPSSRGSSQPRDWTQVSHTEGRFYHLNHQGSSRILEWVAYPFSRGPSWLSNQTGVSCITDRFFTSWAAREAHFHLVGQLLVTVLLLAAKGPGLLALHIYAQEKSESTSKDERESGYMMACSIAAFLLRAFCMWGLSRSTGLKSCVEY